MAKGTTARNRLQGPGHCVLEAKYNITTITTLNEKSKICDVLLYRKS